MNLFSYNIIIFILFISVNIGYFYKNDYNKESNLIDDGFTVFYNATNKEILEKLPNNYLFANYSLILNCTTYSSFHRDHATVQSTLGASHPIYTLINYYPKINGTFPLLSVIPGSHKNYVLPKIITISGNFSTSILFNTALVHAGAISKLGKNRFAIQNKIYHIDDFINFQEFDNFNSITKCKDESLIYDYSLRIFSICYPITDFIYQYLNKKQINWFAEFILGKKVFF